MHKVTLDHGFFFVFLYFVSFFLFLCFSVFVATGPEAFVIHLIVDLKVSEILFRWLFAMIHANPTYKLTLHAQGTERDAHVLEMKISQGVEVEKIGFTWTIAYEVYEAAATNCKLNTKCCCWFERMWNLGNFEECIGARCGIPEFEDGMCMRRGCGEIWWGGNVRFFGRWKKEAGGLCCTRPFAHLTLPKTARICSLS